MSPGAMPTDVLEDFETLQNELVNLHERWALYREMFGKNEERFNLLNSINAGFFVYTDLSMYLDIILTLCRYTDPAETMGKPNLTLHRLVNVVKKDDATFGSALEANEWAAVKTYRDAHFKDIRNLRIGHNDLNTMKARFNNTPTNWPSRAQVVEFLTLCTELMERVHQKYIGRPFAFDGHASIGQSVAEALVKVLEAFVRLHSAEVEGGKTGWMITPPKDWYKRFLSE